MLRWLRGRRIGDGEWRMSTYYVAWWNLENLFDEENAPLERRSDKVRRAIGKDIVGWTPQLRDRKVAQLASVLARMNAGTGPGQADASRHACHRRRHRH